MSKTSASKSAHPEPGSGLPPRVTYTLRPDGIAVVELCRPEARNALDSRMRSELWAAFQRFADDRDALVMTLCSQGPHFCAGGDLKEMRTQSMGRPPADFLPIPRRNVDVGKPIVAAVQGAAHGGGFLLAQTADLVVASDDATLGITEARWGRGAPWAWPLPAMVGTRNALQLLLTAEPVSAERGLAMGLVNEVVAPGELRAAALALSAKIAALAPLSVRAGLALGHGVRGLPAHAASAFAERLFEPVYDSGDALEGPRAFQEKRPAQWTGHLASPREALNGGTR